MPIEKAPIHTNGVRQSPIVNSKRHFHFNAPLHLLCHGNDKTSSISWIQRNTHRRSCICEFNNPSKAIFITSAAPFLLLLLFSELRISDIAVRAGIQSVFPRRLRHCREGAVHAFDGLLHVSSVWMEFDGGKEKQKACMDCLVPYSCVP